MIACWNGFGGSVREMGLFSASTWRLSPPRGKKGEMEILGLCLRRDDPILRAIQKMDRVNTGIAFVVDEGNRLIGVVTDGDIRRAILEGVDLESSVEGLMTKDPVVVRDGSSDEEIIRLLQSAGFQERTPAWIPVVDNQGVPVDLRSQTELMVHGGAVGDRAQAAMKPARVLVIGGAGYIGSTLVHRLLDAGYSVTVLDRLLYGDTSLHPFKDHPKFQMECGDTRHLDDLVPVIQKADAVVHLAELVGDPLCVREPQTTFEINYLATASIARICDHLQINRFVYLSSCSVYGTSPDPDETLDESSPLAPVSLYAKMKINSERVVLGMGTGNFSPCVLRLGTAFGMSHRPRFDLVVNTLTAHAVRKRKFEVFGGNQWRPHVHVADVTRAIQLVLESPIEKVGNEVFNVVGENRRIGELADVILKLLPDTEVVYHPAAVDPRNYRVSGEKAKRMLGFIPSVSVREGVQEIVEALKNGEIEDYEDKQYTNAFAFVGTPLDGAGLED